MQICDLATGTNLFDRKNAGGTNYQIKEKEHDQDDRQEEFGERA